jgi:O-antigen/teichoic acid export membrane protein
MGGVDTGCHLSYPSNNDFNRHQPAHISDTQPVEGSDRGSRTPLGKLLRRGEQAEEERKRTRVRRNPGRVRIFINAWFDRLTGAVGQGGFSAQEAEYEAHRTSRDYIWNTVGFSVWGMIFPILTIVVTQLRGVQEAGMFSIAYVMAMLLYFLGIYGVRTYQVSDLAGTHSFADYQVQRVVSVLIMLVVGHVYCQIRGYSGMMMTMCMGMCFYRAIDALGEVYEGRLQQVDKLYLAGVSLSIRSLFSLFVFSVALLIVGDLGIASIAMAVAALITFILVTFPLALLETPPSAPFSLPSVVSLFKACFPLFVALFMFNLIDNLPKFLMEGVLSYDNQLYFNAMYFPAQAVLLAAGFIYKPLLVRMANAWAEPSRRKKFDLFIIAMTAVIVAITVGTIVLIAFIGIPIMNFLYGLDFEDYRSIFYVMIVAGGLTAIIEFYYQVITILRRQKVVTELYLITTAFSVVVLLVMINISGLDGAVLGYAISMGILAVLLLREYISVRIEFERHPEVDDTCSFAPVGAGTGEVQPVSGMDARYGVYDRADQVTHALEPVSVGADGYGERAVGGGRISGRDGQGNFDTSHRGGSTVRRGRSHVGRALDNSSSGVGSEGAGSAKRSGAHASGMRRGSGRRGAGSDGSGRTRRR